MADLDGKWNGSEWVPHCVTASHNQLWKGDPTLLWANATGTQAYTSLVALGSSSVGIAYAHGWQVNLGRDLYDAGGHRQMKRLNENACIMNDLAFLDDFVIMAQTKAAM